ncbi:MAG: alpha/beta fold hydrolase [Ktedonobacteraceae bacterium]
MEYTAGMVAVNGTRLYYEQAGSGYPLVLIHGFTLNTQMWEGQFGVFAQNYRVIRYDMRGSGQSAMPTKEPFTEVDDLLALLDALGVSHAIVLGLSRGGRVAIDFALAHPERICALVLVDPALGGWQWSEDFSQSMRELEITARTQSVDIARQRWLAHPLFLPVRERPELAKQLAKIVASYSGWMWLHSSSERDADLPTPRPLEQISVPTLLIMGERDIEEFQAIANHIAHTIPHLTKLVLPSVGHMSNMEAPENFNEAVLGFLKNLKHQQ